MVPAIPLKRRFDVSELVREIDNTPAIWNQYTERTDSPSSPHREVDDVWYRYCGRDNFEHCHEPHQSVWYPQADMTPAVYDIVEQVCHEVHVEILGGVLMTRIPPGKNVYPHVDGGWHADFYDKICVSVKANKYQAFSFPGVNHVSEPGDAFWFENSIEHWVTNPSDEERISLIICLKQAGE